jgi:hypothetical protein
MTKKCFISLELEIWAIGMGKLDPKKDRHASNCGASSLSLGILVVL